MRPTFPKTYIKIPIWQVKHDGIGGSKTQCKLFKVPNYWGIWGNSYGSLCALYLGDKIGHSILGVMDNSRL